METIDFDACQTAQKERESVRSKIAQTVAKHLKLMSGMGICFEKYARKHYPDFPVGIHGRTREDYLPPLSCRLQMLLHDVGA